MAPKLDLKRAEKAYFSAPRGEFDEATLGSYRHLMVDGQGSPGDSPEYAAALAALYPLAYAVKFFSKRELGRDYVVPPLEGLWWADDRSAFTQAGRRDEWRWTLMLMVPEWITADHVAAARASKANVDTLAVRLGEHADGRCLSVLHLGSFADEAPVLHRLHHEVMPARGVTFNGEHHEIYLSDPRRTPPEKLRTILRQPVKPHA
ncbi:MAG: GyrI-like domain-containing protein [Alteraurantiacibacter sp.]